MEPHIVITLADAELARIETAGDTLQLHFAVVSASSPQIDGGWLQGVTLHCAGTRVVHRSPVCIGRVREAALQVDGHREAALALPFAVRGAIRLSLYFAHGEWLELGADGLSVSVADGSVLRESLAC